MRVTMKARSVVHRARRDYHARQQLLTLPEPGGRSAARTVYFLTPDHDQPAGGIRVIYRHVDILNRAGIPAAVLHQRPGFRCTWFEHQTVVRSVRHTRLGPGDLLVVGERNVGSFPSGAVPYPHVVFNQNTFETWAGHPERVRRYYREGPAPLAMVTVSEYARAFLVMAFPEIPARKIRLGLDAAFHPGDGPRDRTIAYMPRKGAGDVAALVRGLVDGAGLPPGWRFDPLDGLRHDEVPARLRTSQVFLSLGEREGFGLPAAEAMACGNYVIGSHGYGGEEFFDPRFCAPVPVGDVVGMARALRAAVTREHEEPGWLRGMGSEAADYIRSTYSREAEERDVIGTYADLVEH